MQLGLHCYSYFTSFTMYYECCVCKRSRQDALLYHFPDNWKRLTMWLKCINRDDLKALPKDQLSNLFVCQKHFETHFITSESRLKKIAYPSLFTEVEILSGVPSQDNIENINPQLEHNYARKRHFDHTYSREPLKGTTAPGSILPQPSTSTSCQSTALIDNSVIDVNMASTSALLKEPLLLPVRDTTDSSTNLPGPSSRTSCQSKALIKNSGLKKRFVKKVKDLTPTAQAIYKEYRKAKQQKVMLKRANRALKFSKEKAFQKLTNNMNPYAKQILEMQINLCTKKKKGYRFSLQEKLIALSVLKQSPKGYRFLRRIFILPSKSTLNKMVMKLNIQTGISSQVFESLNREVTGWNDKKKWCSLIFDEMSLAPALNYDKKRDFILGYVDLIERKRKFADHALVFLLRGAVYKWQQPICYYFCEGATSGIELKYIIKNIITAVVDCGLKPVSLICDQGSAFQSALKSLTEETKRDQIHANQEPDGTVKIRGLNLNVIYDPCHLIKGLRNNFITKNISMDGRTSKWTDIVDVYKTDCSHAEVRLLHKLNDEHVIPEKIKKMKVKNCVKVLSSTMSAALSYTAKFSHYADGRPVSETLDNTAKTVLFLDQLFDSVNGASMLGKKSKGKCLRTAVTNNSPHHVFWNESIKKLQNMKYVDSTGTEKSVPSLANFITTLKSYQRLWQLFKKENMRIMRPRYFNSDPIENFFGQVRAYNFRNNDPDCHSFSCTYKSLLITRILKFHNETFNCEDDPADQVLNLQTLFDNRDIMPGHPSIDMILEQARREKINVHSRAYTAGWVVRKVLQNLKSGCTTCKNSLTTRNLTNIHDWISHREYTKAKNRLHYPSEGAVRCFGTIINESNEYLEIKGHETNIAKNIKEVVISKYSFDFIVCTEHKLLVIDNFVNLVIKFAIINWCRTINKILKGTDIFRLSNRSLPMTQKMALEKYNKKLKNKSFNK
ncbi:unnamed protein product [Chilo suppressalis]|uniref:THAP-type domain-containing protein n=1 Tax=Chilo suppressalis TaxID=168631 RepID=A0ABN8EBE8_CHISP|nr:unnamed protein product [Chilo suppressalis]CAH0692387.1 unnamed protein product [Chilo suppressalis]